MSGITMKYIFPLLLLFVFSFSHSQNMSKPDSLSALLKTVKTDTGKANVLNALAKEFRNNDPDTSIYFANAAFGLSEKNKYLKGMAIAYLWRGTAITNLGKYGDALMYLKKGVAIFHDINDKQHVARSLNNIGIVYEKQGNYSMALDQYFSALKTAEEISDNNLIATILCNIGHIYTYQSDYKKTLDIFFRALKIAEDIADKTITGRILNSIGVVYDIHGDYSLARDHFFKALKTAQEMSDRSLVATIYTNIGISFSHQKKYSQTLDYYFKSLTISESIGDPKTMAENMCNIGSIYTVMSNYADAYKYLYRALGIYRNIGAMNDVDMCYYALSELYEVSTVPLLDSAANKILTTEQMRMYALYYHKLYVEMRDTLFSRESVLKELNYDFERKEAAAGAEQDKKDLLAREEKDKNRIIVIGIILLLIMVAAFFFFRQRSNKLLFENKEKLFLSEKKLAAEELNNSRKQLDNYMESILQKNEMLEQFKSEIDKLTGLIKSKEVHDKKMEQLDVLTKATILTEDDWEKFKVLFEQVHKGFFVRLKEKFPAITPAETRLICLTKLNLDAKHIAAILGISANTVWVSRYRLRKKLGLPEDESIETIDQYI